MAAKTSSVPATETTKKPERLVSLDAYRGFVMLAMASSGFALASAGRDETVLNWFQGNPWWKWFCAQVAFQFEHVAWSGCAFWDLIQPSFMFMVGVAMPYSYANRQALGQPKWKQAFHVLLRSLILVALGVFLTSNGQPQTKYLFTNVLSQIGLGYPFLWLLLGWGWRLQLVSAVAVLGGYWYFFFQHPLPGPEFDWARFNLPADWYFYNGLSAHWNIHSNAAAAADVWFLNQLPQPAGTPYVFTNGGYQTLNFVPSLATMIFGLMTGEYLRSDATPGRKAGRMLLCGLLCLAVGLSLDPRMWPFYPLDWALCPIVKRIWTPSWAIYSTGWTLIMLSMFYWIIDVRGWKWWAFPLVVVGMNSIAIYCAAQLLKPWIKMTLRTHFGQDLFSFPGGQVAEPAAILFVLWLMCLWMYRQKIFVRI